MVDPLDTPQPGESAMAFFRRVQAARVPLMADAPGTDLPVPLPENPDLATLVPENPPE